MIYPLVLNGLANFLIIQDKLEKADVILVLAGDSNGERVEGAANLFKLGYAPKILMSGGPAVWNLTYAQNMREEARLLGIPDKDILIQDRSKSTYEDIKFSFRILKKINAKSVILVSSPYHMRRAVSLARKLYPKEGIKVIAFPCQKSEWKKEGWWLRHEATQPVIHEYMALFQYLLKGWLF
ncbi:MAG: YdcF family protein [Candidatus Margulisiibacteriota bacterium]